MSRRGRRAKRRRPRRRRPRRWVALFVAGALAALAAYALLIHESKLEPSVALPRVTATIGSGSEAVAVGPGGEVLGWMPVPEEVRLPRLPIDSPPESGRLAGPVREQARVLGAAPPALRPYLAGSSQGETGVVVELRAGIELRFGDATRVREKWRAAAAVLADPSLTALDYVDLHAPQRPAVGGSGHTLPALP